MTSDETTPTLMKAGNAVSISPDLKASRSLVLPIKVTSVPLHKLFYAVFDLYLSLPLYLVEAVGFL
jgi:hypothetical protein